jgi:hypothetical protein
MAPAAGSVEPAPTDPAHRPGTLARSTRALAVYAVLTIALTWPLALRLRLMEPGDAAYFAWEMAWEIHALETDPQSLPDANIFYPARYTLGMDEPVLGTMILALPLSAFTHDAVLLFNLVRLLTFLLSALFAYLLARELGCGEAAALVAGALFAFSPIRTDRLAHLSTLGTQWLPLVLLFLFRFAKGGRLRDALLSGLFFVLTAYACGYFGLSGLLVLPLSAVPLLVGRSRLLIKAVPAALLAVLALLPLRALHRAAFAAESFTRSYDEAVFYSAPLQSFLATGSDNRIWGELTDSFRAQGSRNLFPGLLPYALALAGGLVLLRHRRPPRREVVALGLLLLGAAAVALGPEVRLGQRSLGPGPLAWVREALPMFQSIRVNSRAGIYLALPLSMLAGLGLQRLRLPGWATALVAGLALLETVIVPIPEWVTVIDSSLPPPAVYAWLAEQPGEFPIVELPIIPADGRFRRPGFEETVYMVRSTQHWKRLVNGNAGFEPSGYRHIRELCRRFPSSESIEALREIGVRYILLHWGGQGPNRRARIERDLPAFDGCLREVTRLEDVSVYAIVGPPPPSAAAPPVPSGQ